MGKAGIWVDNEAHLLHIGGRTYPCDRDVETMAVWQQHALLLSSDTDCLSLWDGEGLVRLTKVGMYPQDLALQEDVAVVCGGADGKLHLLTLPDLLDAAEYPLPGMPERLCIHNAAYVLTLLPEPEVHTALLTVDLATGQWTDLGQFGGIPEGITADQAGLWVVVSEGVRRLHWTEIRT